MKPLKARQSIKRHRTWVVRWTMLSLFAVGPMLAGVTCESGDTMDQVRTGVAPAVSSLFGAMGDLVGEFFASLIEPLPDDASDAGEDVSDAS